MSNLTPFQIGQKVSDNFAPAIREQVDYSALDKIMSQAASQGENANFDSLMGEIIKRVSPQNRKEALGILEKKKQNILQPKQLESYKALNISEDQARALQNLPESERKEAFKNLYSQNLKTQETRKGLKSALDIVNRQQELINTGHIGPKLAIIGTARNRGSLFNNEGIKTRSEYAQLGKSLIQYATNIPIRNRLEFETLAEKLFDPTLKKEEAQGTIDAMKRIINNSLSESGEQNQSFEKSNETIQIQEGRTATGRNGEKIIFKGGKWQQV